MRAQRQISKINDQELRIKDQGTVDLLVQKADLMGQQKKSN